MAQAVKNPPATQETWVQSLGWEDPLDKGTATHSSILAWRITWTEEPGRLQCMGSQRVGHKWVTLIFIVEKTNTKLLMCSSSQKEIEENNRMGKTKDLFKKIRDTKGTFHAKIGKIKDRNGMDLTEAEDIKKRCKNTQKNYTKKIFTAQIIKMVWSLT